MRQRVCIISFSAIHRDGRVLRQIETLAPHYDLTVVGYGPPPVEGIEWIPIDRALSPLDKVATSLLLLAGRVVPALYDYRYWHRPHYAQAHALLQGRQWDAFYANEWSAVPIALATAETNAAPVIYDAHEYTPLVLADNLAWRWFYAPMLRYLLRRYTPRVNAALTVCQPFADRYAREFGFTPTVVLNAPRPVAVPDHAVDPGCIRLVHHGNAQVNRHLEVLIEAMPLTDARFHLYLMLVEENPGCLEHLKQVAARLAPDRVTFVDPVAPSQIVPEIAQYDLGLILYAPANYSVRMTLPNKLFDALNAGLGVVVGQSPPMIEIVERYGCGVAVPRFDAPTIAATLNSLAVEDIPRLRAGSLRAAQVFNANTQMSQVLALFRDLLAGSAAT